jgi:hypothetical protein
VLTKEISLNDLVLAEITGSSDTFVIVNPVKILTDPEALILLSLDVEGYPSTDEILSKISGAKG